MAFLAIDKDKKEFLYIGDSPPTRGDDEKWYPSGGLCCELRGRSIFILLEKELYWEDEPVKI